MCRIRFPMEGLISVFSAGKLSEKIILQHEISQSAGNVRR